MKNKLFISIMDKIDKYQPIISKTCLWNNCQLPAIKSHSHSEKFLRNIASNNTVYGLTHSAVSSTKEHFFKKLGVQQASIFSGFCQHHDSQLFSPIENCSLITNSSENAFLLFMRSLFFEYHQKKSVKMRMTKFKKLCKEENFPLENEFDLYVEGKDEFIRIDFPAYSTRIYDFYKNKEFQAINSIYIKLTKRVPIAVTTMICPLFDNFDEYENIQPLFSFNIIPFKDLSLIVISWFKEENKYMNNVVNLAKSDANKLINYLTFMETENYYLSHDFYNKCIIKEKSYVVGALHNRFNGMRFDEVKILYNFIDDHAEINFNC